MSDQPIGRTLSAYTNAKAQDRHRIYTVLALRAEQQTKMERAVQELAAAYKASDAHKELGELLDKVVLFMAAGESHFGRAFIQVFQGLTPEEKMLLTTTANALDASLSLPVLARLTATDVAGRSA